MINKRLEKYCFFYLMYFLLFGIISAFLFWRCRYGFGDIDESFYLTIPYRLVKGDSLLVNEWHLSQLSGFLLYPIMKLYLLIFGNTTGIILSFRYIFTFFWCVIALFLFYRLKIYSRVGSAVGSFIFLIFTPLSMMTLSYNTMGLSGFMLSLVIAVTARKHINLQYIVSGVFYAISVLCCPVLIIGYFFISIILFASLFFKNKKAKYHYYRVHWLFGSIGALAVAILFIIFVFSRASFSDIVKTFPQILFSDPEHNKFSILYKTALYFYAIIRANYFVIISFIGLAVLFFINKFKNVYDNNLKHTICFILASLLVIITLISYLINRLNLNHIMLPLSLLGFYCAINSKNKTIQVLFRFIYLPGLFYSYCVNYSSNQGFNIISAAMTISSVVSALIIVIFLRDILERMAESKFKKTRMIKRILIISVVGLFSCQILIEVFLRYVHVFYEPLEINSIRTQNIEINSGPEKGIITSKNKSDIYYLYQNDIKQIMKSKKEKVLFLTYQSYASWLYLSLDKDIASYSAWLSWGDNTMDKLEYYYNICTEKIPEIVYIQKDYCDKIEYFQDKGYTINETDIGNYILIKN